MLTRTRRGTSLAGAVARTATVKWASQVLTWAATLVIARHLTRTTTAWLR